ncbi:MAG: porin [Burkholderiales bacterium]
MNKKLVALAVAGVLASPLAAQAQTANVTLYGRLNLDMEIVQTKLADGTKPNVYRVSSNSSRLGVRGTESLGGGLNAIFQLESSVAGDAGGGTLAGRETFVGLQGGWGTVKIGNFLAPYDDIHPIFGNVPTLTTSILSTAAIWAVGPAAKGSGGFDARLGNSVRYDSPNVSGFTGSIQASSQENALHAMVWSMGGFYNNGPIQAGLAWERNEKVRGAGLKDDAISLAGGYNFGVVRVAGVYERLKYDAGGGSLKRDFYGVSATANLGPGQLYAGWFHANDGKGSAADGTNVAGVVKGADTGADQYTISYTYPLSKRTLTYVGYNRIDNDTNARYTFNINPVNQGANGGLASEGKPQGVIAGVVHFF